MKKQKEKVVESPVVKPEEKTPADFSAQIIGLLQSMSEDVKTLSSRVNTLEQKEATDVPSVVVSVQEEQESEKTPRRPLEAGEEITFHGRPPVFKGDLPSSVEISNLMREVFGTKYDFAYEIEEIQAGNRASFLFSVIVPEELQAPDPQKKPGVIYVDKRTKNIEYAEGLNGIYAWAVKVRDNVTKVAQKSLK